MTIRRPALWWWLLTAALVVAIAAVAGLGVWQYTEKNRTLPAATAAAGDTDVIDAVTHTASDDVVKLLSYTADTVAADAAAAAEVTTGEFTDRYKQLAATIIPTAQQQGRSLTTTVTQAGLISLADDKASVLLFVNQASTTRANPTPQTSNRSIRLDMSKTNGNWLVAGMQQMA